MIQVLSHKQNPAIRLIKVKLVQRLGLTYLKPRAVTWVYRKDNADLLANLKASSTSSKLYSNYSCGSLKGP